MNNAPLFSLAQIKIIVGLGNPGPRYHKTRHNAGFLFLDYLFDAYGVGSWQEKHNCHTATIHIQIADGVFYEVLLVKPMTGMNISGIPLQCVMGKSITPDQVLVCHDELEKRFGAVLCSFGGSAKGHNGIRSLIEQIGFDFWRLRIGIDRPLSKSDVGDYVLSAFSPEQYEQLHREVFPHSLSLLLGQ